MQLREAIQQLAGTKFRDNVTLALATVDAVDMASETCSCTAISGKTTADFQTVSLMAEVGDGLLMIPAVGSTVVVAYSDTLLPVVIAFSELDEATFWVNGILTLKDGTLGGIPIVGALLQKFNNLENKVNTIIQNYNLHFHTNTAGPTGPPSAVVNGTLTPTQLQEIENTNVTHG